MEKEGKTNQTVMEVEVDSMGLLPRELIIDVLSRLPAKIVCKFSCVSKQWLNLISDPYFKILHCNRSRRNPLVLIWSDVLEGEENNYKTTIHISTMDMKGTVHTKCKFVVDDAIYGSIYGSDLISFIGENHFYVCNPTIGEFVSVLDTARFTGMVAHGFGFLPSTNEYKIIHLSCGKLNGDGEIRCEIYTLRNGGVISSCRSLESRWPFKINFIVSSVCVNGVFYWIVWNRGSYDGSAVKVMSLDLEKEEFGTVVDPPLLPGLFDSVQLKELKGVLCFVVIFSGKTTMDIWVLKDESLKKSHIWEKEYAIDFSTFDGFSLSTYYGNNTPTPYRPVDIRNGKILIELMIEKFWYYNIESKSFRAAEFFNEQLGESCIFFESFFSLGGG